MIISNLFFLVTNMENSSEQREALNRTATKADGDVHYQRLRLGLIMKLAFCLYGNIRKAALTAIWLTIFINSVDTSSDICLLIFYLSQGLTILAVSVAISDYFPGLLVLAHHYNSESWKTSTYKQKCWAVGVLVLQPFTSLVTNIAWLCDVTSIQNHRLARISTVLHGSVEAPVQFIILLYAYSKEVLPLPWDYSSNIVDNKGNILPLGKISIFSLVFTCIGLLKASCETFELHSVKEQIFASIYALINLFFRITSMAYILIYLENFSIPCFVAILGTNYLILMCNNETNRTRASTSSTLFVSAFMPICISCSPEQFQITTEEELEMTRNGNDTGNGETKDKIVVRKRVSFILAIVGNILIFCMDAVIFLSLQYTNFVQDTIWSNLQLQQCFCKFLVPMFILSIIVSLSFSHIYEQQKSDFFQRKVQNMWRNAKRFSAILTIAGLVAVSLLYGFTVQKLSRHSMAFLNGQNRLILVHLVSDGPILGCDYETTPTLCHNLTITQENFRTAHMELGVAYVQSKPNETINISEIDGRITNMYELGDIIIWEKDAPKEIKNSTCKKCLTNSFTCIQQLNLIQGVERCDGKFKICSFKIGVRFTAVLF